MQFPIALLSLLSLAAAAPTPDLARRAEATCGSQYYSAAAVNAASVAGCNHFRAGTQVGSNNYPHRYNNYEGFDFGGVSGPYQEFPIMASGQIYNGGSPGPDRVVINEASCRQAGVITHTGASGNNFVGCSGTS